MFVHCASRAPALPTVPCPLPSVQSLQFVSVVPADDVPVHVAPLRKVTPLSSRIAPPMLPFRRSALSFATSVPPRSYQGPLLIRRSLAGFPVKESHATKMPLMPAPAARVPQRLAFGPMRLRLAP